MSSKVVFIGLVEKYGRIFHAESSVNAVCFFLILFVEVTCLELIGISVLVRLCNSFKIKAHKYNYNFNIQK